MVVAFMLTESQVVDKLRVTVAEYGGVKPWAEVYGLHPNLVRDILRSARPPTKKTIAALGLRPVVRFERAE